MPQEKLPSCSILTMTAPILRKTFDLNCQTQTEVTTTSQKWGLKWTHKTIAVRQSHLFLAMLKQCIYIYIYIYIYIQYFIFYIKKTGITVLSA